MSEDMGASIAKGCLIKIVKILLAIAVAAGIAFLIYKQIQK